MSGSLREVNTAVIGGGQSGLAVGYYLARYDREFAIFDANDRIGDAWRHRWDSLRLFTQARYSSLPGLSFPAPEDHFPTKDEVADYLETYALTFELPVCLETTVKILSQRNGRYVVEIATGSESRRVAAENVVVATGGFTTPNVPPFNDALDPAIMRFHSSAYRNPDRTSEGPALVVGAGNAGAEIATELAASGRRTFLSGPETGSIPLGVFNNRPFWWLGRNVITADSWLCEKIEQRSRARGDPLVRLTEPEIRQAGVERVARTQGVENGKPVLNGERPLDVASVVWATGFQPDYEWIDLPRLRFDEGGYPVHERGAVPEQPGLYFIGLPYQSTVVSASLGGVGADAQHVVDHLRNNCPPD